MDNSYSITWIHHILSLIYWQSLRLASLEISPLSIIFRTQGSGFGYQADKEKPLMVNFTYQFVWIKKTSKQVVKRNFEYTCLVISRNIFVK